MTDAFQDQLDNSIEGLGLLTPAEAAELVGVSRSAIAKAEAAGKLRGFQVLGKKMYRRDSVLERWPNREPLKRSGPREQHD